MTLLSNAFTPRLETLSSKDILTESFYSNELHRQNIPEYNARLYKGGSQTQLVYFDHDVLDRYLNHREIFDIVDTVASGDIHFTIDSNPYLSYPVVNTYKSFCDSCSELYKLLNPDSLSEIKLKYFLQKHFNFSSDDFIHPKSQRPLGKLDLLKHLCNEVGCDSLYSVIEEIKNHRSSINNTNLVGRLNEYYVQDS